jgi:hypothetical protein
MPNRQLCRLRLRISFYLLTLGAPIFIVTIALGWYVSSLLGLSVAVLGVLLGKNKLVCPRCGKPHLSIAAEILRCPFCGAPYFEPKTTGPHPNDCGGGSY